MANSVFVKTFNRQKTHIDLPYITMVHDALYQTDGYEIVLCQVPQKNFVKVQ